MTVAVFSFCNSPTNLEFLIFEFKYSISISALATGFPALSTTCPLKISPFQVIGLDKGIISGYPSANLLFQSVAKSSLLTNTFVTC